jgi:lactoylglutathione lyase
MPNVFTRDIDRALAFYRDLLGLSVVFRFPFDRRPEHVVLRLGDSQLALTAGGPADVGLEPGSGNSFELVVWCDDVDREASRLSEAGAPILVEPYDHVARHRRAYVADPDGNWIALVDAGNHAA